MRDVYHAAALVAVAALGCNAKSESRAPAADPKASEPAPDPEPEPEAAKTEGCQKLEWPPHIDLAEASGATVVDGQILVVSDSGNNGAYLLLDADSGAIRERGRMPLDDAGDDLEGLSGRGDQVVALSSAGWVHEYRRTEGGFELAGDPYPIGPKPWRCKKKRRTNCGPNWEGLCLGEVAIAKGVCDGYAATKRGGALVCVRTGDGGRLELVPEITIDISPRQTLAGCAISEGRLWAVTNVLGANAILEIGDDGAVTPRLSLAPGSTEAVAAAGDVVYRFSDTSNRPSLAGRYRCR